MWVGSRGDVVAQSLSPLAVCHMPLQLSELTSMSEHDLGAFRVHCCQRLVWHLPRVPAFRQTLSLLLFGLSHLPPHLNSAAGERRKGDKQYWHSAPAYTQLWRLCVITTYPLGGMGRRNGSRIQNSRLTLYLAAGEHMRSSQQELC